MTELMTPPEPRRLALRRVGGALVVASLAAWGLAGGLWLGSPATAATPPLKVRMAGDIAFAATASGPLLDVSDLAPGAAVTGSMEILDDSDSVVGSGWADTILLQLVDGAVSDTCDLGDAARCLAAGAALRDALTFTVSVTGDGTDHPTALAVSTADLEAGLPLATELVAGQAVTLTVEAALPDRDPSLDNPMQYGQFAFDLGLSLDRQEPGSAGQPGGSQPDTGGDGLADGETGPETTDITVAGTQETDTGRDATDNQRPHSNRGGDDGTILVLDGNQSLSHTGLPVGSLLGAGGATLLAGLALLLISRRRSQRGDRP